MEKSIEYKANGKLLLSGEYLVLAGARALAFPVRFGQKMIISPLDTPILNWTSEDSTGTWFRAEIDMEEFTVTSSNLPGTARFLRTVLFEAKKLQPHFLKSPDGFKVNVNADYPVSWGLGSSSTLISLIAQWAGTNSFELYKKVSTGSGFDIAAAVRTKPFFYRLTSGNQEITEMEPGNALREYCFFGYLGNKQDSAAEVRDFLQQPRPDESLVEQVSYLTERIGVADDYDELAGFVEAHEDLLSGILKKPRLKAVRFPDFPGQVKSLGAWGGDFAMFVSKAGKEEIFDYLKRKGIEQVFTFNEISADHA